jgi:hypothetical protein
MVMRGSFVVFFVSRLIGIRDFESDFIMFVEPVTLEGVHANGGLQVVFKVNETQQVLSALGSGFADQPDLLEPGIRSENVYKNNKIVTIDLSFSGIVGNTINVDTVFGVTGYVEEGKGSLGLGLVLLDFGLVGGIRTNVLVGAGGVVHV